MYPIIDGIHGVDDLRVGRVYVIECSDGLTLIDTSLRNSLHIIERQLRTLHHPLSAIKRILITHAHPDHIGSLAAIEQATGTQVYAHHRYESAVIRGERPMRRAARAKLRGLDYILSFTPTPTLIPVRVDHEFTEGDRLDMVVPGMQVVDTPGHSPGHCGFWLPDKRLYFGGDVLIRVLGGLRLPLACFTPDMIQAQRSIHKIAEMGIDILCLGHGAPYIGNASHVLRAFANTLDA